MTLILENSAILAQNKSTEQYLPQTINIMLNKSSYLILIYLFTICFSEITGQSGYPISEFVNTPASNVSNRSIDTQLPVYAIPSEIQTGSGSVNYSIPINVPQGVNSLQPKLSVSYNSGSSNGLLGWAWNINAISAISRSRKIKLLDGEPEVFQYNSNDAISLDGQRLILYSGTNLSDGSQYRTLVESYQKVTKLSNGGFEVIQKDGSKRYYGTTPDSRLEVNTVSGTSTVTWLLDEVRDRNSNSMLYYYIIDQNTNEFRLDHIDYAGIGDNVFNAQVEFHYSFRNDYRQHYQHGVSYSNSLLLREVRTTFEGIEFSKYEFGYSFDGGFIGSDYTKLVEVRYWATGQEVNKTLVQWNSRSPEILEIANPPSYFESNSPNFYGARNPDYGSSYVFMDIDGNGTNDILSLEHEAIQLGSCFNIRLGTVTMERHDFKIYSNLVSSSGTIISSELLINSFTSEVKPDECHRNPYANIFPGDFNGDGLQDFLLQRAVADDNNEYYLDLYLNNVSNPGNFNLVYSKRIQDQLPWEFNPSGLPYKPENHGFPGNQFDIYSIHSGTPRDINFHGRQAPNNVPFRPLIGDFDGDGITDYAYLASGTTTDDDNIAYAPRWKIIYHNSDLTTQSTLLNPIVVSGGYPQIYKATVSDYSGDGQDEIQMWYAWSGANSVIGCKNRSQGFTLFDDQQTSQQEFISTGDINGDGIKDLIGRSLSSNNLYYHLCNGTEFLPTISTIPNSNYPNNSGEIVFVGVVDIDGDSRDDIVVVYNSNTQIEINVHYNKVNGWLKKTYSPPNYVPFQTARGAFQLTDLTGSGFVQLYYQTVDPFLQSDNFIISFRPNDESHYVYQISDGFDRLTTFDFGPLTVFTSSYERDYYQYPNPSIAGPFMVLKSLTQHDFQDNIVVGTSYSYKSLRLNLEGLGVLGFDEELEHDGIRNMQVTNYRSMLGLPGSNETQLFPRDLTIEKSTSPTVSVTGEEQISYENTSLRQFFLNGKWNFNPPRIQESASKNFVEERSSKNYNYVYDNFNNVVSYNTQTYENSNLQGPALIYEAVDQTFVSSGSWVDWQPSSIHKTITRQGESSVSSSTEFNYHPTNGNLLTERTFPGSLKEVKMDYVYDPIGNITRQTLTAAGQPPVETNFTWDDTKRFIERETNALNWVTEYAYDNTLGVKTSQTDITNGLSSELFTYDNFGRLASSTSVDGNLKYQSYIWDLGVSNSSALYYISTTGTLIPDSETWLDGRLMQILNRSKNRNSEWVQVLREYDLQGKLIKESLPHLANQSPIWTEYFYNENFGRLSTKNTPQCSYDYSYSGRSVTETNISVSPSRTVTKVYDAIGNIVQLVDNGGTIIYQYNSWNKVKSITCGSSTTSFTYDPVDGTQTSLSESSMGTTTYEYDALGRLSMQTDSEGNTFEMTYDQLNRITSKSGPDGSYYYYYDSQLKGLIDQKVSPYQSTIEFQYDNIGRLTILRENINGKNFDIKYEYDPTTGMLSGIQYPNGFAIENQYDSQGYVTSISRKDNNETIWQYTSENEFGLITGYQIGNINITKSFNSIGMPTAINTSNGVDIEYSFNDQTGNLESRTDNSYGISESFIYDDLDRLMSYSLNGSPSYNLTYDASGNILSKSNVGTMGPVSSNGQNPQVSNNPNTISSNSQIITYTPFHSVSTIMEGNYDAAFIYGPDDHRKHMRIEQNGEVFQERYYIGQGLYEEDLNANKWTEICFVPTPAGIELIALSEKGTSSVDVLATIKDHIGSIICLTDLQGTVIEEYRYDPWGLRRDVASGSIYYSPNSSGSIWVGEFYRGFTAHEHLDCFGLINMNGRLYDPLLGRMLSTDLFVQNIENTQSFNRYTYSYNNPLRYTDPNGEVAIPLIFAAVNVAFDLVINDFNMNFGEIAMSAASGALAGVLVGGQSASLLGALSNAIITQANRLAPTMTLFEFTNASIGISPMIGFGTSGLVLGANFTASGVTESGNWSLSVGLSRSAGVSALNEFDAGSSSSLSVFGSYYNEVYNEGIGFGSVSYYGNLPQRVGILQYMNGDWAFRVDEDFFPGIGDGKDRFRTGGLLLTYRASESTTFAAGLSVMTGSPSKKEDGVTYGGNWRCTNGKGLYKNEKEVIPELRAGILFGGIIYNNQAYFAGHNSEKYGQAFQRSIHTIMPDPVPYFEYKGYNSAYYGYYGSHASTQLYY